MAERDARPRRSDDRDETDAAPRRKKSTDTVRRRKAEEPAKPARKRSADSVRRRTSDEPTTKTTKTTTPSKPRRKVTSALDSRSAAGRAARYVQEMTGSRPEGLTSLERTDDGWRIGVEVLEARRIPDSTDILALYSVDLDQEGDLVSYRRERRYYRGHVSGEQ